MSSYILNGDWNLQVLTQYLPQSTSRAILPVFVDHNGIRHDTPIWKFMSFGEFTLASYYNVQNHNLLVWPRALLWKIVVPPRTRTFLWKFLDESLLTNSYRFHCHVAASPVCTYVMHWWKT